MALIKFGGGVAQIAGSIGGTVFARNRYGYYARNRTKPVNPASPAQQNIRSILSLLMNAWSQQLTPEQRATWDSFAMNVPMLNRLGEQQNFTGVNHFVRSNAVALLAGLDRVDDAPGIFTLPAHDADFAVEGDSGEQELSIVFDDERDWCDEANAGMLVYASRPQDAHINFFKGPYRFAGMIAGDAVTAPTSPATLDSPFAIASGQRIFTRARIIRADGRLSEPFRITGLVDPPA